MMEEASISALPSPCAADRLCRDVVNSRMDAGRYLLDCYVKAAEEFGIGSIKTVGHAARLLVKGREEPNGTRSAFVHSLKTCLSESDLIAASDLIERFSTNHSAVRINKKISFDSKPNELLLSVFAKEADISVETNADVKHLAGAADYTHECVSEALSNLSNYVPDLYDETCHMVASVCPISSSVVNAGSSWHTFGTIFLRKLQREETWTAAYEHIVHEAAHHYVYLICSMDPIVADQSITIYSPLRGKDRPALAVFHATLVLLRIQFAVAAICEAGRDFVPTARNLRRRQQKMRQKFFDTSELLLQDGRLTELGEKLMVEGRDWLKETPELPI